MNTKELETISYDEAIKLLGVTRQTLHNATSRGVLTPLPRRARKPGQLVKRQVELFIDKDLSLKWLSPEEAVLWQEIKQAVTAKKTPDSVKNALAFELVQDKIAFLGTLMEGVADIAIEILEEVVQAVQSENLTPDRIIEHVKKSQGFRRITYLLGIDMDAIPDETVDAINTVAYEVAERVQAKLMAMLFKYAMQDAAEKLHLTIPERGTEHQDSHQGSTEHAH